jgi:hypothetical protein
LVSGEGKSQGRRCQVYHGKDQEKAYDHPDDHEYLSFSAVFREKGKKKRSF